MTMITDSSLPALRARFGQALAARLPEHIGRLGWDDQRLAGHQHEQLRALLAVALERSPFHARRLAGIDPGRFEPGQLAELPVMTKQQMMASFDELLTDRAVTRARAEQQLAASAHELGLLDGRYVCLASGGSSGVRGVFVQTVEEYTEFAASVMRPAMAPVFAAGGPPPGGVPVTIVAAASPTHSSGFAAAAGRGYPVRMTGVPATLPLAEIVRRLNDAPPAALLAHTSTLVLLAREQHDGRLRIAPQAITAVSELLTDEGRVAIQDAFGVPPVSGFVSTEGLVGHTRPGGAVMRFATDLCIVELVDARNQPVADGTTSAKVLLTNLHNHTQPLIRYELTDRFLRRPADGDPYLHASVEGRADEIFSYGTVAIDPLVIRTVMVKTPSVIEYQIRQTKDGIDAAVVADGALDRAALASSLRQSLRAAGLREPHVHVHEVAGIARHPRTGKTRRFIAR
jgi:phenylacetate-coenzyme A ligase PaaK-like adenylate-forming protein